MTQRHEDSDEDTYVSVGSAFELLETSEDIQRAKERKEKEQYVTDSQGRRRFHGAFTGGFSAGYFNTVGTKEGWAPSSFVSSRRRKAEYGQQKPEDFMDEEIMTQALSAFPYCKHKKLGRDLGMRLLVYCMCAHPTMRCLLHQKRDKDETLKCRHEKLLQDIMAEDFGNYGIAPKTITAKEEFSGQRTSSKRPSSQPTVIPGMPPLQNLIVPARSTVGAKMLMAMGWKEGEGVGPKVMKYPPKAQGKEGSKVYGCARPGEDEQQQHEYAQLAEGFLFAPRDVAPWQIEGKDDLHGIGYSGMQEQAVLGSQGTTKALYGMSGHAFGIGALEEEDDEDVYGVESLISYNVTLVGEGDITMERKYGWTGGPESDSWSLSSFVKASKPLQHNEVNEAHRRTQILSYSKEDLYSTLQKYPPPSVPRDFVPVHKFTVTALKDSGVGGLVVQKPLTSTERTQMLADTPGSVFSLMSAKDRDRLKGLAKQLEGQQLPRSSESGKTQATQHPGQPQLQSDTPSKFSVEQLKPFAADPVKQARYEAYLSGKPSPVECSSMTEWERQKEWKEFTRTERVYQPLATSLTSKFIRAQAEEGGGDKMEKLKSPESDALQAAQAGMFGVLTREVLEWHPHRVLCKRFNIPDPYPNSGLVGRATDDDSRSSRQRTMKFLQADTMTAEPQQGFGAGLTQRNEEADLGSQESQQNIGGSEAMGTSEGTGTKEDEGKNNNEEESEERPPLDLFKTIFAESSSESEMSHESDSETNQSQDNKDVVATATQANIPTQTALKDSGATQWQDLSLVSKGVLAATPELKRNRPVSSRWDSRTTPSKESKSNEKRSSADEHKRSHIIAMEDKAERETPVSVAGHFGPALPPDLGKGGLTPSDSDDSSPRTHSSRRHFKHKHKYHKKSHKEGHYQKKERKNLKHKHSKHK